MTTKVKIKDFQSIEKADLEIKGFTVITGKNNSGKSAVQRAIRGVFQNARGNAFVRHGATHCEVSLDFEDGNSVTWKKGKKENKYVINGKEYDKVGAKTPEPLEDFMVQPITAGGREIWSQFAPQFTGQVFLLNDTGSVLAEAISDVERVQTLNKAMKQSERDKRSANSTLKVRKTDEKAVQTELEHYAGLNALGLLLDTIESLETKIEKVDRVVALLNTYLSKRDALLSEIDHLTGVTSIQTPDTTKLESVSEEMKDLTLLLEQYGEASVTVSSLQGVSTIELPSEGDLLALESEISTLQGLYKGRERAIKGANLMTQMCSSLSDDLIPLQKTDFLEKTENTLDLLDDLHREREISIEQINDLEKAIDQNKRDQVSLQQHLKDHLHEEGSCPLCGSVVC